MNVHNELFNGVRQLRWQNLSPVVSTFSTSIRLLSSFFIKHCILPPSFSLFLSSLSVVPHPVCLISGLSLRCGDVDEKKKYLNSVKLQINVTHYLHTLVLINLKILTILEIKHIKHTIKNQIRYLLNLKKSVKQTLCK